MKLKYSFILLCTCLSLVAFGSFAWAQSIVLDLDKIKPLTPIGFMPRAEFEAMTDLYEDTPYDDEFLSFKLRLPKGWTETSKPKNVNFDSTGNINEKVLGVVARYIGPIGLNNQRPFFTMEALELTHEISARDWFIHFVLKSGLSIEQVGLESEKKVEALYVEIEKDVTYIVRVQVIVNGPRMIVARHYLPQDHYKEGRELQAQIIDSFDLTNRQEVTIEPLELHGFMDQSFFDYPVSWALSAPTIRSINRMSAMLYHGTTEVDNRREKTNLAGQVNIYLTNKSLGQTRGQELAFYKDKFVIDNYKISNFIENVEMQYHDDMDFGVTQSYKMKALVPDLIDYELWVSVMENQNYIYFVTLLSPARNENFYTWARNKEAFALVLKGIRLKDENVDYYRFIK